jgi:hypothetical protein
MRPHGFELVTLDIDNKDFSSEVWSLPFISVGISEEVKLYSFQFHIFIIFSLFY